MKNRYFYPTDSVATDADSGMDFRISHNGNSGGGQVFLAGKYRDEVGEVRQSNNLNGKHAVMEFVWQPVDKDPVRFRLEDPASTYEIKPRGDGNPNVKFEIQSAAGTRKNNVSRLLSALLMLPKPAAGAEKPSAAQSVLSRGNYRFSQLTMTPRRDDQSPDTVVLTSDRLIVEGASDEEKHRKFFVSMSQRMADIDYLSRHLAVPEGIRRDLSIFADIYNGSSPFSLGLAETTTGEIMRRTAALLPVEYSGITDALPALMDFASSDETAEVQHSELASLSRNRIFFGAPGTGKSFRLQQEVEAVTAGSDYFERATFHPDSSYASFVGTYKPVPVQDTSGERISYRYVPGPFMRILSRAIRNQASGRNDPHFLIIEEINRANVGAVFGDVFQLLDRTDSGVSQYPIHASEDVRGYLAQSLSMDESQLSTISLPSNLFIWATMNSADQGVFPMDTAFKRRWDFEYIGVNDSEHELQDKFVTLGADSEAHKVEWNQLRRSINRYLMLKGVNEDKQLGPYFLSRDLVVPVGDSIDGSAFGNAFKHKVISYLFEDAARTLRSSLFEGAGAAAARYSDLCSVYDQIGVRIFHESIVFDSAIQPLEHSFAAQTHVETAE